MTRHVEPVGPAREKARREREAKQASVEDQRQTAEAAREAPAESDAQGSGRARVRRARGTPPAQDRPARPAEGS